MERKSKRQAQKAAELRIMREAKRRDGGKCRVPGCRRDLPIDACHLHHRGLGGNPSLSRTTRQTVIALCRWHHGLYDTCRLRIEPLTAQDFDGKCEFWQQDDDGKWRPL